MTADQKQIQRKAGIRGREALGVSERAEANHRICQAVLEQEVFRRARRILAYAAFRGEVDLSELLERAQQLGKEVACPVCLPDCQMLAACPRGETGWTVGAYGIRTPVVERSEVFAPETLDLVLVPCTAFDEHCRRIGMGKGYYDRYLPRCTHAYTMGIAFECQRVQEAAADPWDCRLDACVTEKGIYRREGGTL